MYVLCMLEWMTDYMHWWIVCMYLCMFVCMFVQKYLYPYTYKFHSYEPEDKQSTALFSRRNNLLCHPGAIFPIYKCSVFTSFLSVCMYVCVSINECSVCTLAFHGTINLSTVSSIFVNEAKLCTGKWAKITLFNSYTTQLKIALLLYKNTIYWDEICNYARCNGMPYTAIHN